MFDPQDLATLLTIADGKPDANATILAKEVIRLRQKVEELERFQAEQVDRMERRVKAFEMGQKRTDG